MNPLLYPHRSRHLFALTSPVKMPLMLARSGFAFLMLALLLTACGTGGTEVANVPTLAGPVVPTRVPRSPAATVVSNLPTPETTVNTTDATPPDVLITDTLITPTDESLSPNVDVTDAVTDVVTDVPPPADTPVVLITETVTVEQMTPTEQPTTAVPTAIPTTGEPTVEPSLTLTITPSPEPPTATSAPTDVPTQADTEAPTQPPTQSPTATFTPTQTLTPVPPTASATNTATASPTVPAPTLPPTAEATEIGATGATFANSTSFAEYPLQTPIEGDIRVTGLISNEASAVLFPYTADAGVIIDVELSRETGNLQPFLLILDPKGRELVRGVDLTGEQTSSIVRGLILPETGEYTLVSSRASGLYGASEGEFELAIKQANTADSPLGLFSQPVAYGSAISGTIGDDVIEQTYTFRGQAGSTVAIEMTATSGDLDTIVALYDNLGNELTYSDDTITSDGTLTDSRIARFVLPQNGYYTVLATQYTVVANAGDYTLEISELSEEDDPLFSFYAPLAAETSRTIQEDGTLYVNFIAGENPGAGSSVFNVHVLLTYYLPPIPDDQQVISANFSLEPCYEHNDVFDALGALSVYIDPTGGLDFSVDPTQPGDQADLVAEQQSCDPILVTSQVQRAYDEGSQFVQFVLVFANGVNDDGLFEQLVITPTLYLSRGTR